MGDVRLKMISNRDIISEKYKGYDIMFFNGLNIKGRFVDVNILKDDLLVASVIQTFKNKRDSFEWAKSKINTLPKIRKDVRYIFNNNGNIRVTAPIPNSMNLSQVNDLILKDFPNAKDIRESNTRSKVKKNSYDDDYDDNIEDYDDNDRVNRELGLRRRNDGGWE
jgi:hypothetical protein